MHPAAPLAPPSPSRFPSLQTWNLRSWPPNLGAALNPPRSLRTAFHPRSWLTTCSAALGVALVLLVTRLTMGTTGTPCIVASMGASAVILYAMPETPAARLWPLFGGHLLSALVGVLATRYLADPISAVALAVGGSLFLMGLFRCIHPPGGATALTVVMGGAELRELGFAFLVSPLLLNLVVLGATAWLLRSLSSPQRFDTLS
jgi:CBS domain-containing membrane protein